MNILFLTIGRLSEINTRGIYTDLMRQFVKLGHQVYIASPAERRFHEPTHLIKQDDNVQILRVKTLNLQKTNVIEKGIGQLLMEYQFDRAINKYFGNINFDLIIYSTPPITFNRVIERQKKRTGARTYLMLKDIFPQNAVDLGMMKQESAIYKMFRKKEERLYEISDRIGCMSPANCEYVIKHNPNVAPSKVELCPNSIELVEQNDISEKEKTELLTKLGIPAKKRIFVYGGNLGKPQGIDFLMRVVEANEKNTDSTIVIVGSGTEFPKIKQWFDSKKPKNSFLLSFLPKDEYDKFVKCCNVGLIFLDPRFTIPNYPSRLTAYLENKMPVLLATDPNCDMGRIAEDNGFGKWALSGDLDTFMQNMATFTDERIKEMGEKGYQFLKDNYTVDKVADSILS